MTNKSKVNPIIEGLMERRTVILEGNINHDTISEVSVRMLQLQTESSAKITLLINSGGGEIYPALQLCDLMQTLMTAPVGGIAIGECGSAATFIMLHCAERWGFPYSRYLIHSGNLGGINLPIGRATPKTASQLLADVNATEKLVTGIYKERLTPKGWDAATTDDQKGEYVQRLLDRGDQPFNEWMSVQEAIDVGLVQKICTKPNIY